MEEATQAAIQTATIIELSQLNQFAIVVGYVSMFIYAGLIGFIIAKIIDRKKK